MNDIKASFLPTGSTGRFQKFSFFLLVFAVLIIVWGAFVRISGSGDGCGQHWPLCHGEFFPSGEWAQALQTWIELFHRVKSGLFGLLVCAGVWLARRTYPPGHLVRRTAWLVLLATVVEGLIGAALVKFGWVDQDRSFSRIVVIGLHLSNTLLLTGLLAVQTVWSGFGEPRTRWPSRAMRVWTLVTGLGFLAVGVSGSWAALSTTLYPSSQLWEGLQSDFQSDSPLLVRLRIFHPLIAVIVAALLISVGVHLAETFKKRRQHLVSLFVPVVLFGVLFGTATLLMHSPQWMELVHLFWANVIWASFVFVVTFAVTGEGASEKAGAS